MPLAVSKRRDELAGNAVTSPAEPIETVHIYPGDISRFARPLLEARFPDRRFVAVEDEDAFLDALPEMEAYFGLRQPKGHWHKAARLRVIQVPGAGVDSILPDDSIADNVVVCNAIGTHEPEMPEFIVGLILAITKQIPTLVKRQLNKQWKLVMPVKLSGMTACIVGLGTIGQSVARRLEAFDMAVTGVRRSGKPVEGVEQVVTLDNRFEVLSNANLVVVIAPKTPETEGIIGAKELAAMPAGSWLVDVSRGGVVQVDDVVEALASGHLAGAAIDVFPTEPLPEDSPYWDVPGLFITPHTAGFNSDYFERVIDLFAINLEAVEKGGPFATLVDRSRGY